MYCQGMLQAWTRRLNGKKAQNAHAMIACSWWTSGAPETALTWGCSRCPRVALCEMPT
jgi:hypothetical protein